MKKSFLSKAASTVLFASVIGSAVMASSSAMACPGCCDDRCNTDTKPKNFEQPFGGSMSQTVGYYNGSRVTPRPRGHS